MQSHDIFISHIHEEEALSKILEDAIKSEFFELVIIFNSSNNKSILVGDNFIKKIEGSLAGCAAAIYLISPRSVERSWINFELGAISMKNILSKTKGQDENNSPMNIPVIPICHSGISFEKLPITLSSQIGVQANDPKSLKKLFESIQARIGFSAPLRTDFETLAKEVQEFEKKYTAQNEFIYKELHHVNLPVTDLKRSVKFYRHDLKLKKITRPGKKTFKFGGAWFALPNGQHLHLVVKKDGTYRKSREIIATYKIPPDIHFALKVSDDYYAEIFEKVTDKKLEGIVKPFPGLNQIYIVDPDNHIIEITMQKWDHVEMK